MMNARYLFVGNRRFVLQEMLSLGLDTSTVAVIAGTHLQRDLERGEIDGVTNYTAVDRKEDLLSLLNNSDFDVLVSNGCPFILPIAQLPSAQYVNIHPSCLPDLRGVDPVIGSVLFGRDAGATCHLMDEDIDTGELDVTTLYQLSFVAEQRVFRKAVERDFAPLRAQVNRATDVYYSRKPSDRVITFQESNDELLRKIKAFNNRSIGCEFHANGKSFRVYEATRMYNPFLLKLMAEVDEGVVVFSYENSVIFRKNGEIIRFKDIVSAESTPLSVGDQLFHV